jgi:hypothetical protein
LLLAAVLELGELVECLLAGALGRGQVLHVLAELLVDLDLNEFFEGLVLVLFGLEFDVGFVGDHQTVL